MRISGLEAGTEPLPGYRLQRIIGRGGFAEVWEATAPDGQPTALKFMSPKDGSVTIRELRTIQTLQLLHHPHLTRVHRVWSQSGFIIVSMEIAEGSLTDLLHAYYTENQTAVPFEIVCHHLAQAAEAIDYLNERRHVVNGKKISFQHGDIKPSNMLLFGDTVKLTDFGLASFMNGFRVNRPPTGTLEFSAPEIFQGFITERSDQYALAISYHVLRTGRYPFPDDNGTLTDGYNRPPPDLSLLAPPERPAIARALSLVPHNRWPTCSAMIEELAQVYGYSATTPATARAHP